MPSRRDPIERELRKLAPLVIAHVMVAWPRLSQRDRTTVFEKLADLMELVSPSASNVVPITSARRRTP